MRRTFTALMIALLAILTHIPSAHAMVLKDVDAQPGVPRMGVVVIAVSAFINDWESTILSTNVVVSDAEAKRSAETYKQQPGVHYVDLLTGTDVTMSGIVNALDRLKGEKLDIVVFRYRGYGLNADAPPSCFMLADWDHATADGTCLSATIVADGLAKAAPHHLMVLDATRSTPDAIRGMGYETWGPSADDWPLGMPVVSVGKSREPVDCPVFSPMMDKIISETVPEVGLTMGMLTQRITAEAPEASRLRCGGATLHVTFGGKYALTDYVIPPVPVPVPIATVAVQPTLPTEPLTPPVKVTKKPAKLKAPTVASLIATGVCAAVGGASWAYGEERLAQYNDPTWARENYPGNNAARIAAGEAEIPLYGYLAVGGFTCAGVGAASAGLTWYFGK